jgi:hypothetical protein
MTLYLYGHLFGHRLDKVANAMDTARSRGFLADCLRTDGKLIKPSADAESAEPPGFRGVQGW